MSQNQLMVAHAEKLSGLAGFSSEDAAKLIETYGPDLVPIAAEMVRNKLSPKLVQLLLAEADKISTPVLQLIADLLPFAKLAGASAGDLEGGALTSLLSTLLPALLSKYKDQIIQRLAGPALDKILEMVINALMGKLGGDSPQVSVS